MHEILFRGKRTNGDEWVYGYPVGWQNENGAISIVDSRFGDCIDESGNLMMLEAPFVAKVDPSTVGQYTGLTDKNGKKIFEGDVVKVKDALNWGTSGTFIGSVGFGDASFRIETDTSTHYRWQDYDCEVIGNIHDNPELLKEAT